MKMRYLSILLALMICGCSYSKTTVVEVNGENVKYGLFGAKGDVLELLINREVSINKEE